MAAFALVLAGAPAPAQSTASAESVRTAASGSMTAPAGGAAEIALPAPGGDLIRMIDHPDARTAEMIIGPLDLKSGMMHLRLPVLMTSLPIDGWLHGFAVEMEDASGAPLPTELLHHVNVIDPDHRELFSPVARRVLAAGRETSEQRMPKLLGVPIASGQRLLVSAMFANPTKRDYSAAYLHVRLFYSREDDGFLQPRDVYPFYVDVMGPVGLKDFALPPGPSERSWEGSPAVDGRLLAIGGHLHNYATEIRFEDVTTGKVIWHTPPETDSAGLVTGVRTRKLWWRLGVKLHTDHVYRIAVKYDNPTGETIPGGGMGAIGGVVWTAKGTAWPAFDRKDPAYVTDLKNTLEAPEKLGGHGHMKMQPPAPDAGSQPPH